jgi:hypothetical protein
VFAEKRLWMRSDSGAVFSVSPTDTARRDEQVPEPSLDLCVLANHVAVLTQGPTGWTLREREGDKWVRKMSFEPSDDFLSLDCSRGVTVVTSRRVLIRRDGAVRTIALSPTLPRGLVETVHIEEEDLYVGINRGEWGGGLLRASLATGTVAPIDRPSGDLCGGTLNAKCDPVHGITAVPWKPGCVVAAVGLVHFMAHGSLVEVCGEEVRTLLSQKLADPELDGPDSSVAFFAVTTTEGTVVAAGMDGLYRVTERGAEREPLPAFKDVGGIKVSFAVPGLALVLTNVNARKSMSGSVPLLVPRQ